ncbi:E3 ubiquitin-protein ligase RNF4-like [Leguminivora glycinivorella]|uniref:E3 ubiquitin-protein ligase RNF4-like n=1 Tax=Leguminivora glycinivorella TaxID=1035111 RepID=UPI00200E06F7|nr:E3 ubiquitin-protein ligase RNF4-like [Leguminivora glycinivorella]
MANNDESVIDLTECSFTLADHCRLNNVVINLDTDDSFRQENTNRTTKRRKRRYSRTRASNHLEPPVLDLCTPDSKNKKSTKSKNESPKAVVTDETPEKKAKQSLGTCPICFEDFCGQALASTKCGHVFCLSCIKTALKSKPQCPTCRTTLRGKSNYHPIFL